jgi:hypothetical protein
MVIPQYEHVHVSSKLTVEWMFYYTHQSDMDVPQYVHIDAASDHLWYRPGRGVDHPLLSSAEVKERVELYIHSLSGAAWPVMG